MGFVDYHGEKEDYYDDVVAYAKCKVKQSEDNWMKGKNAYGSLG